MATRNIPGKPGNKGYTQTERDENALLIEDVRMDYQEARWRLEWARERVRVKGTTFTNNVGNVVPSAQWKVLTDAQAHMRAMIKIYQEVIGAEAEEGGDGADLVVLDFDDKGKGGEKTG